MDESNLEIILDAMAEPVFLLDKKRRIVHMSLAATRLFGKFQGHDFSRAIRNPDALELVERALSRVSRPARSQVTITVYSAHRSTYRMTVVRLERINTLGAVVAVTLSDISYILEAEQMRSDFVANVSHELRSPLTTLSGFIETLQTSAKEDPEARSRFLDIMAGEAERMNRIISDLLSLSRVEENERLRPETMIDLVPLINRAIAAISPRLTNDEKTIALTHDGTSIMVPGDEDQLTQVFHNLIDNAGKYSRPGTEVTITINKDVKANGFNRPVTSVSISDCGEGISEEHLSRLTERFYRVDKGRSRQMGGTGLGLAIVKHIINRHRGRLAIESTVGKGSTFSVFLPQET